MVYAILRSLAIYPPAKTRQNLIGNLFEQRDLFNRLSVWFFAAPVIKKRLLFTAGVHKRFKQICSEDF